MVAENRIWFYIDEEFMAKTDKTISEMSNERLIYHIVHQNEAIKNIKEIMEENDASADAQIEKHEYRLIKIEKEMLRRMAK